ncbi:precursor of CEP8 [Macadamia integrifolia]|uniref:precursor of CEP8 n=1 Tax=Macadamia integrifolia TaxID=60698 RepID=UPI001C4F8BDD|nr:precursor of CEP8 [Macadamia integrifolia]
MAIVKFIFVCVLLILACSLAVIPVEGRHLKSEKTKESNEKPMIQGEESETVSRKGGVGTSALHGDEFQPAAPAHVENIGAANPGPIKDSSSLSPDEIDDFRPTDPGHSPGVGH